jgi:FkbH-like protein
MTVEPFRIGVTASFTATPLSRPLLGAFVSGQDAEIVEADFNLVHQTLLDPAGTLGSAPDALLVLWRIEDIFTQSLVDWVVDSADPAGLVEDVRQLGVLVKQAAGGGAPVVVTTPPVPTFAWLDPLDTRTSVRLTVLHGRLVEAFLDGLGDAPVTLVDLDALVRSHGVQHAYDTRNDLMYRQPFSSSFTKAFGQLLGEALNSLTRAVPKVLAVDADNTLWGGIIGEDGADGVIVGDSFPGNGFRALQNGLAYQVANGTLLVMVSKNNAPDVAEIFEVRQGDLVLTDKHFATKRVDWNSKADNLMSIAEELNLGVDSFVFIDDNDVELDEVRQRLPEVGLIKVTDEPSEIAELTAGLTAFRFAKVSSEDRQRTSMMQVEVGRKTAAAQAQSHEDFLASLGLTVRVFKPESAHVGRVTQLVNKTNQFNLTTIRRDEGEVSSLVASDDHRVYAAEVSDKFGGYGLVAVAIVATGPETGGDTWEVDTFLMSCRVLRRGVENAVIQCIADDAAEAGASLLAGDYRPTAKNSQVATFYPELGFTETRDGHFEAQLPLSLTPAHVTIERDA